DDAKGSELLPYEKKVLLGLFKGGLDEVTMSDLKYKFKTQLTKIQEALYQDAMKKGWFRTRPDKTRLAWHAIGLVVFFLGIGLTIWTAAKSTFGLVPLAIVIIGFALIITAHRMPARTGKGSAMLSRVRGFRRLFDEGDEDLRARFAENHNIFSEYLPYAIVFGCTEKWAKAFEGLDAEALGTSDWYGGAAGACRPLVASALGHFGT